MGGLFKTSSSGSKSSLTREQRELLGPLAEFYSNQFGNTPGVDRINSILAGTDDFVNETSRNYYNNALLGPSMREFERVTRPQIENSFAGIGGTLSSRRGRSISDARSGVIMNAQSQGAQFATALSGQVIQGLTQQDQLRFSAAELASVFGLTPTSGNVNQQAGPGFGLVGTAAAIAAAGLIL